MQINQIISPSNINLGSNPTYIEIYEAFEPEMIMAVPLVHDNGELSGVIYRSDFLKADATDFDLKDILFTNSLIDHFHILEALREFLKGENKMLPVVDTENYFIGFCFLNEVQTHFTSTTGLNDGGSLIVIQTTLQNYSLVDVGRIVESNQAKVLNLYLSSHPDSNQIEITLVVNVTDISDIIATFNRFDYYVTYSSSGKEQDDILKERYDSLMHFLDI